MFCAKIPSVSHVSPFLSCIHGAPMQSLPIPKPMIQSVLIFPNSFFSVFCKLESGYVVLYPLLLQQSCVIFSHFLSKHVLYIIVCIHNISFFPFKRFSAIFNRLPIAPNSKNIKMIYNTVLCYIYNVIDCCSLYMWCWIRKMHAVFIESPNSKNIKMICNTVFIYYIYNVIDCCSLKYII